MKFGTATLSRKIQPLLTNEEIEIYTNLRILESKWRKYSMDRDMESMGVKVRGIIKARAARTAKSLIQQNIFINPVWHWRKKKAIQMAPAITIVENWFGLTGRVSHTLDPTENAKVKGTRDVHSVKESVKDIYKLENFVIQNVITSVLRVIGELFFWDVSL